MSTASKLRHSRNIWKQKASKRASISRDQRKTIKRQRGKIRDQNEELRSCKARIAELESMTQHPKVFVKVEVIFLALQLFVVARIGLRAISRVLKVISSSIGGFKPPCPQTICNWVNKLSLARLWTVPEVIRLSTPKSMFANGWMFMIDESIGHACGKMLLVLGIRVDHYANNPAYPNMSDVRPIAVAVAKSWTGESIAAFIQELIGVCGRPAGFLSDGGKNLGKAMTIVKNQGFNLPVIRDISHFIANLLESKYGNDQRLDDSLSICGESSKRLKQSILACLAPPKVRTNARFMNLHRLVKWADKILDLSPVGRAASGSVLEKLRKSVAGLSDHRSFIEQFSADARFVLDCLKHLKQQGLNRQSKALCRKAVRELRNNDPIKLGTIDWLNDHMKIARKLGLADIGMLASTDSIESVFGLSKSHGVGNIKDPHHMALKIGALCGDVTMGDAHAVATMPHALLENAAPQTSLQSDRIGIFSGLKNLESISHGDVTEPFMILPQPKNRDNCHISEVNTGGYNKSIGPPAILEASAS